MERIRVEWKRVPKVQRTMDVGVDKTVDIDPIRRIESSRTTPEIEIALSLNPPHTRAQLSLCTG